ncbi:MAG: NAD(+) diphosphatase [Bacteroides sp.]|nr:NAD(+) diphosphatase [Bacteroides sp.]MBQ8224098.1 NAD(+) diphosphatase [Bacteroides sp.]
MEQKYKWFIFHKSLLLLSKGQASVHHVPYAAEAPFTPEAGSRIHQVTLPDGEVVKAFAVNEPIDDNRWQMVDLRASYDFLPLDEYKAAGKAFQILYWDEHSRFCPVCGTPTNQETDIMKKCPHCNNELYPNISTAIIVLIRKEEKILLVRAHNFRGTFYGLVAGFLEAGETLEQCVRREVMEETGLSIKNIRYFDSQPWPYPSGLMVGFTADYDGGEIKLQADELSAGSFFSKDNLPELPRKLSIARRLIDWWLEQS